MSTGLRMRSWGSRPPPRLPDGGEPRFDLPPLGVLSRSCRRFPDLLYFATALAAKSTGQGCGSLCRRGATVILRRVSKHVKAQNWMAIVIDFVIVVLGVFIGLQAQDWSQQRADRDREIQIVTDLLADIETDRSDFADAMALDERKAVAANLSLKGAGLPGIDFEWDAPSTNSVGYAFELPETSEFFSGRSDRLWTDVVMSFFPTASTTTYDALVGAGENRIIRDRGVFREIQLYRYRTDGVTMQNEKLLAIRESTLNVGASYGLAPMASVPAEDYFRLVASEPQLAAAIRIEATFALFHRGEIQSADEHAAELQDRLRTYLNTLRKKRIGRTIGVFGTADIYASDN